MTTQQVETATVIGTITLTGNAAITITAARMGNSPKSISVAVTNGDIASVVAGLIRTALAFDADVSAQFLVSGSGANVVLTSHVAQANDSTINIAITNGTCTGLTPALTSTNTTAGDGIDNGYCTLQQYKDYQNITTINAVDDGFIELAIEAASRWMDTESNTNFYGVTETDLYDVPLDNRATILPNKYFISVSTLTNGDSTVLTTSEYFLLPANETPKTGIGIKKTSSNGWKPTSVGETIQAISIAGVWGYSLIAPSDVLLATLEIARALYGRRSGQNMITKTIITPAGVVQIPEGVPAWAADTILKYRRVSIG